jgi:hypothetical protein
MERVKMVTTNKFYSNAFVCAFNKEIDITSDEIKVMFLTATHTPDLKGDKYTTDLTNELPNTNGYVTGGFVLADVAIAVDGATGEVTMSCSNYYINDITITYRYMVVYDNTPSTDKPLLLLIDEGTSTAVDGTILLEIDANGFAGISV